MALSIPDILRSMEPDTTNQWLLHTLKAICMPHLRTDQTDLWVVWPKVSVLVFQVESCWGRPVLLYDIHSSLINVLLSYTFRQCQTDPLIILPGIWRDAPFGSVEMRLLPTLQMVLQPSVHVREMSHFENNWLRHAWIVTKTLREWSVRPLLLRVLSPPVISVCVRYRCVVTGVFLLAVPPRRTLVYAHSSCPVIVV